MIGILLLSHGQMAAETLLSAEMIIGPIPQARTLSVDRNLSLEESMLKLRTICDELNGDGDGVLILTDLFGGTPNNLAADLLLVNQVEILTGFNLPMLIKAAGARHSQSLGGLVSFLKEYGQKAIVCPSELL